MGRRGLGVGLALGLGVALGTSACAPLSSETSPASTASPPAAAPAPVTPAPTTTAPAPAPVDISAELASLESTSAARIGVSAVDTATGRTIAYRADERFGYASTIKVFAASLLLQTTPPEDRARLANWTQSDVDAAGHSPATGEHVADGLSLAQLAEAAVRQSDNTALNVLLANLGGPQALDAALTQLGDDTSDVVDVEPALNTVEPGSTANTTTPAAFTADLRALLNP
ncbi:class A beta-lactamase, partial [Subtercola sp. Z020]